MIDETLQGVVNQIHDRWFLVDDIDYDEQKLLWCVPFSRDPTSWPPKERSLKGVKGARVLEVAGVDSFDLEDTERIGWYPFNVLIWKPEQGLLEIVTCMPLTLRLWGAAPQVRVYEQ